MKYCCALLFLLSVSAVVLHGQTPRLEVTPDKSSLDSLETIYLRKAYYVTNRSKDTVDISVTVSFDWCMPRYQPRVLLPGQTDSIVFECLIPQYQPWKSSGFTIHDGRDDYRCELHYSLTHAAYINRPVPPLPEPVAKSSSGSKRDSVVAHPPHDSVPVVKLTAKPKQDPVIIPAIRDSIRVVKNSPGSKRDTVVVQVTRDSISQAKKVHDPNQDSVLVRTSPDTIRELRVTRIVDETKRNPVTGRERTRTITKYYSNDSIAVQIDLIYYRVRKGKRTGRTNFCVETHYYSDGKIMIYLEEFNWGYSYCETCPRREIIVTNKRWDRNGNLIYEKNS